MFLWGYLSFILRAVCIPFEQINIVFSISEYADEAMQILFVAHLQLFGHRIAMQVVLVADLQLFGHRIVMQILFVADLQLFGRRISSML